MRSHRLTAWLATMVLSGACADGWESAGALVEPPAPPVSGAPAEPTFPSTAAGDVVYRERDPLYRSLNGMHGTLASRYVLRSDSSFALQFSSERLGFFEYRGTYAGTPNALFFRFGGGSFPGGGSWAHGVLVDDVLTVKYNDLMHHSDFYDGEYVRTR